MSKPNSMDTRNRDAFQIVEALRAIKGFKLCICGTHKVDAKALADTLPMAIDGLFDKAPVTFLTGCADVGTEKAVRLAAKGITGRLATVFHRATTVFGVKQAELMRDQLLAQEADALLLVTTGGKICEHLRERFSARQKEIYEIEIE